MSDEHLRGPDEATNAEKERALIPAPHAAKAKPEAPPNPILVLARKHLRRWDIVWQCSGQQQWIESAGSKKKLWLILQNGEEVSFEPLD